MTRPLLVALLCLTLSPWAPAQGDQYADFVAKFTKALEFKDDKLLDGSVKRDPASELVHFSAVNWDYKRKGDPATYGLIEVMMQSWQRVFGTSTLEHYERYIASRGEEVRMQLFKGEQSERGIFNLYHDGLKQRDRQMLINSRDSAVALARTYEALGHCLHASKFWSLAGEITDKLPDRTLADRKEVLDYFRSFVRQRDQWEWNKDSNYLIIKNRIKADVAVLEAKQEEAAKRKEEGYVDDVRGLDALVLPGGAEQLLALKFEALKKPHVDMFLNGGSAPGLWLSSAVINQGPAKLDWFRRSDVFVIRPKGNRFGVTVEAIMTDAAKHPMEPITPSAKYKTSVFHLDGAKSTPYAMWFWLGGEQEMVAGISQNLQPTKDNARLYYRSASSWVAAFGEHELRFYDDNLTGKLFDENLLEQGIIDFTRDTDEGVKVHAFDGVSVDGGTIHPLGDFAKIGETWYNLRGYEDGAKVGVRPVNPEYFKTGTVSLKWKGPAAAKPEVLILTGEGDYENSHFNIAGGAPVEVPAGTYRITFGRIASGKGSRMIQANIFQGDMEPVGVKPGGEVTVTLGGKFNLDCKTKMVGKDLVIDARSIRVLGEAGEQYARINGATPTPDVVAARNDKGSGLKVIGSFVEMDADNLNKAAANFSKLSNLVSFFPVPKGERQGKLELKAKPPFKDPFIGLQQKKHRLFGKLSPIWKKL